jgi:hypothetical protein
MIFGFGEIEGLRGSEERLNNRNRLRAAHPNNPQAALAERRRDTGKWFDG